MILIEVEQGSEAWHAARAGVLTASVAGDALAMVGELTDQQATYVAKILAGASEAEAKAAAGYKSKPTSESVALALEGIDPAKPGDSAVREAWRVAIERVAGVPIVDQFQTFATKRGRFLEAQARELYELREGVMVIEQGLYLTDDRRCGYSTDGHVMGTKGGIEVKCPTSPQLLGATWQNPAGAEADYLPQIEFGLWLTGWHWVDLVVYCPWLENVGKELFVKRIWRDDDRIEKLEQGVVRFLKMADQFEALLRADLPTRYERTPPAKFEGEAQQLRAAAMFAPPPEGPDAADAMAYALSAASTPTEEARKTTEGLRSSSVPPPSSSVGTAKPTVIEEPTF